MSPMSEPMSPMGEMDCDGLRDSAAELALGVLSGADRARALMHLEHCLDCQKEVDSLSTVGDALFELVPPVEPPVGFESRVAARLQAPDARAPSRSRRPGTGPWWRRAWVPVAAGVALVLAAGGGGWAIGSSTQVPSASPAAKASVSWASFHSPARRGDLGEVFISWGRPVWVFMTVDLGQGSGVVGCFLVEQGGQEVQVGSVNLVRGFGYWGAAVQAPLWKVTGARIVASDGRTLATASFR